MFSEPRDVWRFVIYVHKSAMIGSITIIFRKLKLVIWKIFGLLTL